MYSAGLGLRMSSPIFIPSSPPSSPILDRFSRSPSIKFSPRRSLSPGFVPETQRYRDHDYNDEELDNLMAEINLDIREDTRFAPMAHHIHPPFDLEPQPTMMAARLHTQQVAMEHTVCIVTKRSIEKKGRLDLQCALGGDGRSHRSDDFEDVRKQPRTTKQANCPFLIIWRRETKKVAQEANREPLWIPDIIENFHNHEPVPLLHYSFIRQASRSPEVLQFITDLLKGPHTLRGIVSAVQQHFGEKVILTKQDVQNFRFRHEKALRQGQSATEAAIKRGL
ncbi:hypothetical protein M231_03041 [Tremella mesenterica]|uniref:Uncharacterized protein n=1 Tax=Tremella mesenterica TaxID=5217 RepID=A0A4Q1BP68_TREME|nr:hypothetical protein M231_03041 [Tremella mesenterica]